MESNATDKSVPREITALLSDERLILRETQRAVNFLSGQNRLRGSGSAAHAGSLAVAESHRSQFYLHSVSGVGAGRSTERRLERDFSAKRFGDQGYARKELVAELGAAFL